MSLTVENRPAFSPRRVQDALAEHYGLEGSLTPLPAEWDQNFKLDSGGRGLFVVKIANRGRSAQLVDFENAAMEHLSRRWPTACSPTLQPSRGGEPIVRIDGESGRSHLLRVLTWIEGRPLPSIPGADRKPLEELGSVLGEMDRWLAEFTHPAMDQENRWDLRGAAWISSHTSGIHDVDRRRLVERLLLQFAGRVVPRHERLPVSVIHNDANDENVLVVPDPRCEWRIAGIVDFGDMLRSHTVNELAIACAYASFGAENPLEAIAAVTTGYHAMRPLEDIELEVLLPLVCMRLCVSVTS